MALLLLTLLLLLMLCLPTPSPAGTASYCLQLARLLDGDENDRLLIAILADDALGMR